jgi:hypothetical protein
MLNVDMIFQQNYMTLYDTVQIYVNSFLKQLFIVKNQKSIANLSDIALGVDYIIIKLWPLKTLTTYWASYPG